MGRHDDALNAVLIREIEDRFGRPPYFHGDLRLNLPPRGTGTDVFQVLERTGFAGFPINGGIAADATDVLDQRDHVQAGPDQVLLR